MSYLLEVIKACLNANREWRAALVGVGNIDAHSGAVGAGVGYKTVVLNLGTSACYMAVMPAEKMGERLIEGIFGQVDDSIVPGMVGFEAGLSAFGDVYAWFKRLLCYPLRDVLSQTELVDAPTRDRLVEETGDKLMDALTEAAAALPQRVDAPQATDWLNGRRNPYPDKVVWRQEESNQRSSFYWLSVPAEDAAAGCEVRAELDGNRITVAKNDYPTLYVNLNDDMINLSAPVTVVCGGKEVFRGRVKRRASHIAASAEKRCDPRYIFSARLEIRGDKVRAL